MRKKSLRIGTLGRVDPMVLSRDGIPMPGPTILPSPTPPDRADELPSFQEADTVIKKTAHLNNQPPEKEHVAPQSSRLSLSIFYLAVESKYLKNLLSNVRHTRYARHA